MQEPKPLKCLYSGQLVVEEASVFLSTLQKPQKCDSS